MLVSRQIAFIHFRNDFSSIIFNISIINQLRQRRAASSSNQLNNNFNDLSVSISTSFSKDNTFSENINIIDILRNQITFTQLKQILQHYSKLRARRDS